ncbi:hypothetical protein PVAG01_02347 [Phlyctema vagabunda]|uniref:C2H2-type domain-containing protein n=1 Tax=Phlyctema vagabunda TaxID=108571 RepID=A0ABR4PRN5_9HELO
MPPKSARPSRKSKATPGPTAGVKKTSAKSSSTRESRSNPRGSLLSSIFSRNPWSGSKSASEGEQPNKQDQDTDETPVMAPTTAAPSGSQPSTPRHKPTTSVNAPAASEGQTSLPQQPRLTTHLTTAESAMKTAARLDASFARQDAVKNYQRITQDTPNIIFDMDVNQNSHEYQKQRKKLRKLLGTKSVNDVLDAELTPGQKLLVVPALFDGAILDRQKKNTIAYKNALKSNSWKGAKDNIATKVAMAKFGLPVEPITQSNFDNLAQLHSGVESGDDESDDDTLEAQFQRVAYSDKPLRFLDTYDERSFGYPGLRNLRPQLGLRGGAGLVSDLNYSSYDSHASTSIYTFNGAYHKLNEFTEKDMVALAADLLNLSADCDLVVHLVQYKHRDKESQFDIIDSEEFHYRHGEWEVNLRLFDEAHIGETTTYMKEFHCNKSNRTRAFFVCRREAGPPTCLTPPRQIAQDVVVLAYENVRSYWKFASNFQNEVAINQVQATYLRAVQRLAAHGGNFSFGNYNLGFESLEITQDLWNKVIKDVVDKAALVTYDLKISPAADIKLENFTHPNGLRLIGSSLFESPSTKKQYILSSFKLWETSSYADAYQGIIETIAALPGSEDYAAKNVRIWSSRESRERDDNSSLVISLEPGDKTDALRQLSSWAPRSKLYPTGASIPTWEFRLEFSQYNISDPLRVRSTIWKPGQRPTYSSFRSAVAKIPVNFDEETTFFVRFAHDRNIFGCPPVLSERDWRLFTFDTFKTNEIFIEFDAGEEYRYNPTPWGFDYDTTEQYPHKDFSLPPLVTGPEALFGGNKTSAGQFRGRIDASKETKQAVIDEASAEAIRRQKQRDKKQQENAKAKAEFQKVLDNETIPRYPEDASRNAAELRRILKSGTQEEKAEWYKEKARVDQVAAAANVAEDDSETEIIDYPQAYFRVPKTKHIRARAQPPIEHAHVEWARRDEWSNSLRQSAYTRDLSVWDYGVDPVAAQFGKIREASTHAGNSTPTLYHQHWSLTEIWKLEEENQVLRNASLGRTTICPICGAEFSGFDNQRKALHFDIHHKQCISGGKCPLCDSQRFATFSVQERKDHLLGHQEDFKRRVDVAERDNLNCPVCHIQISYDEFPGSKGVLEHLGSHIPDLYKFCDRCGTSLHELSDKALEYHDTNCMFESFPDGTEQPEELWGDYSRYCTWCGLEFPPGPNMTPEFITSHNADCGYDHNPGSIRFCGKCGLDLEDCDKFEREVHDQGCKQPGGYYGKFCPICGENWKDLRSNNTLLVAHSRNCHYKSPLWSRGDEFNTQSRQLVRMKNRLSEKEKRLQEQQNSAISILECPMCHEILSSDEAKQKQHFESHTLLKNCPICNEAFKASSATQKAHLEAHTILQQCPVCGDDLEACQNAQRTHFATHGPIKIRCPYCREGLPDDSKAQADHLKSRHIPNQPLECLICENSNIASNCTREHFKQHILKARDLVVMSTDVSTAIKSAENIVRNAIIKKEVGHLRRGKVTAVAKRDLEYRSESQQPLPAKRGLSRSPAKSLRTRPGTQNEPSNDERGANVKAVRNTSLAKKSRLSAPAPDVSFQSTVENDSEVDTATASPRKRGRNQTPNVPVTTPFRRSTRSVSATPSAVWTSTKRKAPTKAVQDVPEEDDTSQSADEQAPVPKRVRRSPAKKNVR